MVLYKDLENFKALILLTAKDMSILEYYIEKVYLLARCGVLPLLKKFKEI